MSKRSVPVLFVGCLLALVGLVGFFLPVPQAETPSARLLMENPGGRVVFTHKAHSTPGGSYGDNDCIVCHHELKLAPEAAQRDAASVKSCSACHGTEDIPDFVQKHQQIYRAKGGEASCVSCHHTTFTGYSDKWNHEEHTSYAGEDCETCHHPQRYEFKPGRFMNIMPQKCANCHTKKPNPMTATTRKDAAHAKCMSCHEDLFDQKLKGCDTCHARADLRAGAGTGAGPGTETGTEAGAGTKAAADAGAKAAADAGTKAGTGAAHRAAYPSCASCHGSVLASMEAYHTQCMGCHEQAGKGPNKAAPCAQCHTP